MTQISNNCTDLVKRWEGCRLQAYQDSVGVWTVGYGHTVGVHPGLVWTQEQADQTLAEELGEFAGKVAGLLTEPVSQNQFDALVCFAYNVGVQALHGSTLLRLVNSGDIKGAAAQFPRWNRAGGQVLAGLTRRRAAEQQLFLAPEG